jgi:DNA-binding response OmpR family regulator
MNRSEHSPHSRNNHKKAEYDGCVLVVDDNELVRQLLLLALETAGFHVVGAATELDLQRYLVRSSTMKPDALVLNVQRSEVDGLGILSRIRGHLDYDTVPVVFLAGCEDEYLRLQALAAGADWFALRPLGMVELQAKIAELIREGRSQLPTERLPRRPTPIRRLKRTG